MRRSVGGGFRVRPPRIPPDRGRPRTRARGPVVWTGRVTYPTATSVSGSPPCVRRVRRCVGASMGSPSSTRDAARVCSWAGATGALLCPLVRPRAPPPSAPRRPCGVRSCTGASGCGTSVRARPSRSAGPGTRSRAPRGPRCRSASSRRSGASRACVLRGHGNRLLRGLEAERGGERLALPRVRRRWRCRAPRTSRR